MQINYGIRLQVVTLGRVGQGFTHGIGMGTKRPFSSAARDLLDRSFKDKHLARDSLAGGYAFIPKKCSSAGLRRKEDMQAKTMQALKLSMIVQDGRGHFL